MAPYMLFAVRLLLAVSLVGLLSLGVYLSPAMDLQTDVAGISLGVVMALVAIALATGVLSRPAAALLILAGPLGMLEFGVSPMLQRIDLLGLAVFILIAGPGRWSADFELGKAPDPRPLATGQAAWALRVAAGLALIVVAFVEKLADPDLALAFLQERPESQRRSGRRHRTQRSGVRAARRSHRGPLRSPAHQRGPAPGDRARGRGALQRDTVVLRQHRARRSPARVRDDAPAVGVRIGPGAAAVDASDVGAGPGRGRRGARRVGCGSSATAGSSPLPN